MATITGLEHCKFLISDLHTDICTYRYRYICIYNIQHDLKSHSVSLQDIASQINNTFDLNQLCGDSTICCMENIFLGKNRVASTASKQVFDYTTQFGNALLDFHFVNVIFKIQYVFVKICFGDKQEDK